MNKKIKLRVNGKKVEAEVPTNRLLIDFLRKHPNVSAAARPIPRQAPVMMTTRPTKSRVILRS